jgi:hypothetical protein
MKKSRNACRILVEKYVVVMFGRSGLKVDDDIKMY